MAATARPVRRIRRRRTLAAGAVLVATLVLTLDQVAASPPASPPDRALDARAADGSTSAVADTSSWARDTDGRIVPVTATHDETPVHPTLMTHPDSDAMGESLRAELAPAAATRPLAGAAGGRGVAAHPIGADSAIPRLPGIDVSSHQGPIDWANVAPHVDFVYAKATEGTVYRNPDFPDQYDGPYEHGVIRGAYHFALPNSSSGTAQADYFVAHGGGWSSDGLTLPGALDIEYNPYGSECYGLTPSQMTSWIRNFVTEYAAREHAYPVIYSTTEWWKKCTGNTDSFASLDPIWVAGYGSSGAGPLPSGWGFYTFWQYSDSGGLPGDQDVFNGSRSRLKVLAENG